MARRVETLKELKGRRVRLTQEVTTGGGLCAPAGTICVVEDKFGGWSLQTPKCDHCGVSFRVRGVDRSSFVVLEED